MQIRYIENTHSFTGQNFPTCSVTDFVTRIKNGEKFYEVTPDMVRLYFDVDIKTNNSIQKGIAKTIEQKAEELIRLALDEKFKDQYTLAIATSHGQSFDKDKNSINKYSVRFWVPQIKTDKKTLQNLIIKMNDHFLATKDTDADHLFEYCGDLFETDKTDKNGKRIYNPLFDKAPYDTNRKMRCIGACKPNENRPLVLKSGSIEDTIISNTDAATLYIETGSIDASKPQDPRIIYKPSNENEQKYCDYVSIIDAQKYFTEYDDWFKFQRASSNIGIRFEIYDQFMVGCKGYDRDNNLKQYERPNDNKRGSLGWKTIYDLAYASDPEAKSDLDVKWGTDLFCLHQFKRLCRDYDPENEENAKNTYKKAKEYFEKYHFKVMTPLCFGRKTSKGYDFISRDTLHQTFENLFIFSEKGSSKQQFTKMWVTDMNIRSFESYDFCPPPIDIDTNTFNLFNGFIHEKLRSPEISENEIKQNCTIFIKHLWYLCGKSNDVLEYVLDYIAHMLQEPGELPRTSIVFKSEQGVGKNLFFEMFAEKILGEKYLLATPDIDHILGRFPLINQKVLVLMDEANGKDSFLANDKIKNFITSKRINFERKGIDGVEIRNCGRMLFFTNNDFPVKIEQSDRRFVVVECSSDMRNNTPYFRQLINAFNDKTMIWSFAQFLLKRDIREWDSVNDRPITQIYKDVQKATVPSEQRFFLEFKYFIYGERQDPYSGKSLYDDYVQFCRDHRPKSLSAITEDTFLKRLKNYSDFLVKYKDRKAGNVFRYKIEEDKHQEFIEKHNPEHAHDDDEPEDEFEY